MKLLGKKFFPFFKEARFMDIESWDESLIERKVRMFPLCVWIIIWKHSVFFEMFFLFLSYTPIVTWNCQKQLLLSSFIFENHRVIYVLWIGVIKELTVTSRILALSCYHKLPKPLSVSFQKNSLGKLACVWARYLAKY